MKIVIVYCSPAGSTRHVAEVIHNRFNQRNVDAVVLDLAKDHNRPTALEVIKTVDQKVCMFMDDIADHIRKRVRSINERPLTQVFL